MVVKKKQKKLISINEIELAIARHYGTRQHIIVPNISWGFDWLHECDVFIIKRSGYAVEIEIKKTKSDLLNDFKKGHQHKSNKIREFFYAIPHDNVEEWKKLIPEHAGILSFDKHNTGLYVRKIRDAKINKLAKKLTTEEQLKVARLGCLRIWNLKQKLIKNE